MIYMQAVIMGGGLGTRLRPLTFEIPKSMVPVNGKPFLEHQVNHLKESGIKKFLFCIGYLGEQIEEYFGDGERFGVSIQYSVEDKPLGTGGALKNAEDKLEEDFVLVNGDTYNPIDIKEVVEFYNTKEKKGLVVLYDNHEKIVENNISLGEDGLITAYDKESSAGMTHVDAGVYVFNKSVLSLIPKDKKVSLETEIFQQLIRQKELVGYATGHRFYDIGTLKRFKKIEEVLR